MSLELLDLIGRGFIGLLCLGLPLIIATIISSYTGDDKED